jgi:signal transduction histidine kinase
MHRLQMRTILLIALVAMSFGMTTVSLYVIRVTVRDEIHAGLEQDLQHSMKTYLNLERQRRDMLAREAALVADLPSLKSLMTTEDRRTIEDGGLEFWRVSGSDFFALADPNGHLIVHYARGPALSRDAVTPILPECAMEARPPRPVAVGDRLYEMVAQPITFGSRTAGTLLGCAVIGFAIDEGVAHEVGEAADADVAFAVDKRIVVNTLPAPLGLELMQQLKLSTIPSQQTLGIDTHLGAEQYLVKSIVLDSGPGTNSQRDVQLIVLKSYREASQFLSRVNRWALGMGALSLLVGGLLAVSISRRVTRPLEALVDGVRALGKGDFERTLSEEGTSEVRELSHAFDRVRGELRKSQLDLLAAERLATIGRMAASISHDLRHYLSAMLANAEFLSLANTPQEEREELISDVQAAVHGMTDLLDSLLIFSRTGNTISPAYESIDVLIDRSVSLARSHPDARGVEIELQKNDGVDAWVDAKKLSRAVFNLLLNACQAARRGNSVHRVTLSLQEDIEAIRICICDSGVGVPASIRETMFLPFVSSGKENGVGLGLTLAQHIAQEHGGSVSLDASSAEGSVFSIVLPKRALENLKDTAARSHPTLATVAKGEARS